MGVTAASIDHALKTLYPKGPHFEVIKESPLLALMHKDTGFVGRNKVIDVIYAGNRARSASFANAQANTSTVQGKAFTLVTKDNYAYGTIPRKIMKQAETNEGALIDALTAESRSMIETFKQDLGADAYSDGSGVRAQIAAAGITGAVITLADWTTAINFEAGDVLELSAASDGSGIKGGTVTLTKVDRDAGTLTCSGNVTAGIATAAALDFVYKQGDAAAKSPGIAGWLPVAAPTATLFYGVDRSVDPTKLGGVRFDGSTFNHEEALVRGLMRGVPHTAFPSKVFMNGEDVAALELILGSKKVYEDVEGPAGIGFSALVVNGPRGKVKVFTDPWAPKGYALGLDLEHWCLESTGEVPEWVTEDGNKLSRQGNADGFEFRLAGYYAFACEAPGKNIRIKLPTI